MKGLQRRDALKLMGAAGLAASMSGCSATGGENDDINSKIVIMGAGLSGIALAAKLRRDMPNAKVILVDKDEKFYYQPGFTLIAVGIYEASDVVYEKADYIPQGTEWIRKNVSEIKPEANLLVLDDGSELGYDYLIVASGVEYDFEAVKGLSLEDINDTSGNISSVYTLQGAVKSNELMKKFSQNGGAAVFCDQKTPMKCSGANKKVTCMSEDRLRLAGNRDKGSVNLYVGGGKLFGDPTYAAAMTQIMIKRKIKFNLRHQIVAVDKSSNTATFEFWTAYRQNGEDKIASELIDVKYDWLHLPPKQKGSEILARAGLTKEGDKLNFLAVDKYSLQSTKFKNIFGIGDICGFASGKTGASVRKMYPILAKNLADTIKGREPSEKFTGYTACPFITKYGKAIMVEFDWEGPAPTLECFGATRESYMSWLVKIYGFKPMVMNGMLKALA